jgi:hypothetical protein
MKPTEVSTGRVRLSYANLFKAKAMNEGETAKFSTALLIPKSDKKTVNAINAAIEVAKNEGKGKWKGKIPTVLKLPLRDGDLEKPDDEDYEGMWFLNASSVKRPQLVDQDLEPITDEEDLYSGCYVRAAINFYAFAGKQNGIAVGLNAVKKLE